MIALVLTLYILFGVCCLGAIMLKAGISLFAYPIRLFHLLNENGIQPRRAFTFIISIAVAGALIALFII